MRGLIIAEGDVTTLCIRLYSELLQEKYRLPFHIDDDTLLGQHAKALFASHKKTMESFPLGHRDKGFNDLLISQCERGILSLGCSYAYSSAARHAIPCPLLALFECRAIGLDPAWYTENMHLLEDERITQENNTAHEVLVHMHEYAENLNTRSYVRAPIVGNKQWKSWLETLKIIRSTESVRTKPILSMLITPC